MKRKAFLRRSGALWLAIIAAASTACSTSGSGGPAGSSGAVGIGGGGNAGGFAGGGAPQDDGSVGTGGMPASDSGNAAGDAAVVVPHPPFDWMGIVGTGQSLSVGAQGTPLLATLQPYHNLKLALGGATVPPFDPNVAALSLVPLIEPIRPFTPTFPGAYPTNIYGETPHTSMANQISALYGVSGQGEYQTVHTVVGESGQGIAIINKAARLTANMGHAYPATLFEAQAIKRLAVAAGKTYGIGAIFLTHGETDAVNTGYEAAVHQLWMDYNTDLRAITGQAQSIPLILTQQQTSPPAAGSSSVSMLAAWHLAVKYPGDLICAGPKYQYQHATDLLHLTSHEYDRLGEKYGEIYYEKVVLGHNWQPLQPKTATKNGNVITVDFNVPVGALNWDENIPPPHQTTMTEWAKGRGFEVRNAGGRATIESVVIDGSKVVITLTADSQAANWIVGYASIQDEAGQLGGPIRGRRGQLRDSNPFVGLDAETISSTVTTGSSQIHPTTAGAFRAHGPRDIAEGASLPAETIVLTKTSDSDMTLSKPWTGATGTVDLRFRSDQRNYCVSFEVPVQ